MKIKVNGDKILNVTDKSLTVKDGRLYNTETRNYEGVDGDAVTFNISINGNDLVIMGTVHGYTCGGHIIIRPNEEFHDIKERKIEHISSVELYDDSDDESLELMISN